MQIHDFSPSGPQKTVKEDSLVSGSLRLISNIVIRAADFEAALRLAKSCPVLEQGGTIEAREIQPRPVQGKRDDVPGNPGGAELNV
ncbi:hypothetical protein [Chitinophaga alhagiae]|uniref:hypothetical protein n=1 Tax=Chitinophaga alhagiae TaxID=2203219 RepID=UPI000E5B0B91|nr:hypothetical protein [Chitinophaga alhagiae]